MEGLAATHFGHHRQVLSRTTLEATSSAASRCCGPTDVRIQVVYSELNPVDLQKLKGSTTGSVGDEAVVVVVVPIPNPPLIPGYGGSGIVQEVGAEVPAFLEGAATVASSTSFSWVGKRVAFLGDPSRNLGSYATQVVVDYRCVAILPPNVSFRDAATIPLAGCTAYEALFQLGLSPTTTSSLRSTTTSDGENATSTAATFLPTQQRELSLLIVGGAGGVGSWATRLARVWYPNLHIIATASSLESQEWCRDANGANQVMKHEEISQQLPGGRDGSVDYILCLTEPVPALFSALANVIRPYGTICLVVAGDSIRTLDLSFCFFKGVTVTTETVFSSIRTNFRRRFQPANEISELIKLVSSQQVQVPLSPQMANLTDDWANALQVGGLLDVLSSGHTRGKLVMRIATEDM